MSSPEVPKMRKVGSAVRISKGLGGALDVTGPLISMIGPAVADYIKTLGTRDRARQEAEAVMLGRLRRLAADHVRGEISDQDFATNATVLLLAAPDEPA